jgi:hypothetical protein
MSRLNSSLVQPRIHRRGLPALIDCPKNADCPRCGHRSSTSPTSTRGANRARTEHVNLKWVMAAPTRFDSRTSLFRKNHTGKCHTDLTDVLEDSSRNAF